MYGSAAAPSALVGSRIWCQHSTGTFARAATAAGSVLGAGRAPRAGGAAAALACGRSCPPQPPSPSATTTVTTAPNKDTAARPSPPTRDAPMTFGRRVGLVSRAETGGNRRSTIAVAADVHNDQMR